jgi:hypothetical protein
MKSPPADITVETIKRVLKKALKELEEQDGKEFALVCEKIFEATMFMVVASAADHSLGSGKVLTAVLSLFRALDDITDAMAKSRRN